MIRSDHSSFGRRLAGVVLLVAIAACEPHPVEVQLDAEDRAFSREVRRAVQDIADSTARDVRALLPILPKKLTLVVERGKDVIPETGETATAVLPSSVHWTVDADRDVLSVVQKELRPTLFHELHHLARDATVHREIVHSFVKRMRDLKASLYGGDRCAPSTAMVLTWPVLSTASRSRSAWCSVHQTRARSPSQGSTAHASMRRRSSAAL